MFETPAISSAMLKLKCTHWTGDGWGYNDYAGVQFEAATTNRRGPFTGGGGGGGLI